MTTSGPLIRAAGPGDHDGIRRVVRDAFGAGADEHGDTVVQMLDALHASGHARVELVALAESGDVVGHTLLSHSWVDAAPRLLDVLVLSPLSVAPDRQSVGTGTALLAAAVQAAGTAGAPALFLEGDPRYYAPRGFGRATTHGFTAPSVRIPDPAFQVVVLEAHESWMTGALVYCEPFWALDCVGLRD